MADASTDEPPSAPSPPPYDVNALVECDPTAPIPTANAFRQQPIPTLPVEGEPTRANGLCDGRWQWYRVFTSFSRQVPRFERVVGADGVTRTETRYSPANDVASVSILFDGVWTRQTNRFPTSDIMIVNGFENMPQQWDVPSLFQPDNAVNQAPPGMITWHTGVDTLTHSLGYNMTLSGQGCAGYIAPIIMVGIRCSWGQAFACRYDIGARLLPRLVYDGDEIEAPIAAGDLHYYALEIGAYDIVTLTLLRVGHDLTYSLPGDDAELTHDYALRGELIAQRGYCPDPTVIPPPPPPPSPPPSPPPLAVGDDASVGGGTSTADGEAGGAPWFSSRMTPITNESSTATLEFFCTEEDVAGAWAIAVRAADVQGPLNLGFEATNPQARSCANGYVGPEGVPIYTSPSALGSLPQCNPQGGGNELKLNRPYYRLSVAHRRYSAEVLAALEQRPACIGYGQMRRYTVEANDEEAANLYVALSTKVSRILISEAQPPTLAQYGVASVDDATYLRARSDDAMPPAADADTQTTASASPCQPGVARTWHIAVYLEPEAAARSRGLTQAAFDLNVTLSSARRDAEDGDYIAPRSAGGVGSTCCGRMTHFVVRLNTSTLALRVRVNVTAGALRAVYVKHGSCAQYPADILGQQCDANVAQCHMTWYERFDRYTGAKRYANANTTLVPSGGRQPDKRAGGDWYISFQDAGVSRRTDFSVLIDLQQPSTDSSEASCDRFGRYDCSNAMWVVPPDLDVLFASSAAPAAATNHAASLMVLPTLLLATWLVRGHRRR